ncbi:hypothetical protein ACETOX_14825 [Edwardsiella piscicida]|uniref:hypothetical protein n=1 Tax=Edwardsiella piscicida TaxID=1263550 RepID=UPI001427B43F|nr:hypothetical protein [Edwardsiella piscicida]
MTTLDPRQLWRRTARTGNPGACKTMHPLHARLKNRKISGKWHKKTGIFGAGFVGDLLALPYVIQQLFDGLPELNVAGHFNQLIGVAVYFPRAQIMVIGEQNHASCPFTHSACYWRGCRLHIAYSV